MSNAHTWIYSKSPVAIKDSKSWTCINQAVTLLWGQTLSISVNLYLLIALIKYVYSPYKFLVDIKIYEYGTSLLCSPKRWIITTLSWLLSSHTSIDYKHEGSWRLQGTTIVGIRLVFVYHRFFINEGSSDKRLPRKQEKIILSYSSDILMHKCY